MPRLIRNRYESLEVVGRGGQGEVLRARDRQHDREVAIKVRRVHAPTEREALLREARVLLDMKPHPGVPMVRDDFFVGDRYYVVMEWVQGETLASIVARDGSMPFEDALRYLGHVASALDHLHAHEPAVIHRDVKPANIILTPDGSVVLVDLGSAAPSGTRAGATRGTPGYVAPELLAGDPATAATDVYSLAATAATLITGDPPQAGVAPDLSGVPEPLRDQVSQALSAALSFDPARRPQTASALISRLRPPERENNLPVALTSFVGREHEVAEVKRASATSRLVTLTGSGGCGKTRLALQVATELLPEYPDGAWLVELAPLQDPTLVPQTAAHALGLRDQPGVSPDELLTLGLRAKRALVVLDNCEHLLDACAALAERLLSTCPHVAVLATSREPLDMLGEAIWRVPSLSAPEPGDTLRPELLERFEAVRLFCERARAVTPGFALTGDTAATVTEICAQLDGIPLAIELAAAALGRSSLQQLTASLTDRFTALTGGNRTALPRQRTLRATIEWSHDLLSQEQRMLLRRLSPFAGSFAPEAACAAADSDEASATRALGALVAKSLVQFEVRDGVARYRMLETIRQYAAERLREAGEEREARDAHAAWYVEFAERAVPELRGPGQAGWLEALGAEHDNLRAALGWSIQDQPSTALRLATALGYFWYVRGHWAEGRRWLDAASDACPDAALPLQARAAYFLGTLALTLGDYEAARLHHERSVSITRELGDERTGVASSMQLGNIAALQGAYERARSLFEESAATLRRLGDRASLHAALGNLGNVQYSTGEYAAARATYEEALILLRELGDKVPLRSLLANLGIVLRDLGDLAGARALHEESLEIARDLGMTVGIALSLDHLGTIAREEGDLRQAAFLHEDALRTAREIGNKRGIMSSLNNRGLVARATGDLDAAMALHGEALTTAREIGDREFEAAALGYLGAVARVRGDHTEAAERYDEALHIAHDVADRRSVATLLLELAKLSAAVGAPERAARLLGSAEALRAAMGIPLPGSEEAEHDAAATAAREALGSPAFDAAWATGRALSMHEAVAFGLTR